MEDIDRFNIESAYVKGLKFTDDMVGEYDPITVATILCKLGLSLYRTVLSEKDFGEMVDTISETRSHVKPFMPDMRFLQ